MRVVEEYYYFQCNIYKKKLTSRKWWFFFSIFLYDNPRHLFWKYVWFNTDTCVLNQTVKNLASRDYYETTIITICIERRFDLDGCIIYATRGNIGGRAATVLWCSTRIFSIRSQHRFYFTSFLQLSRYRVVARSSSHIPT